MPKQEGQKSKLLTLLRILEQKTDEEHLLNVPQLVELLEQQDILAERKSIYSDIDTLRSLGYDIQLRRGRGGGYWLASRTFELSELKLLVDAVQASKVVSARTSSKLIHKLEASAPTTRHPAAASGVRGWPPQKRQPHPALQHRCAAQRHQCGQNGAVPLQGRRHPHRQPMAAGMGKRLLLPYRLSGRERACGHPQLPRGPHVFRDGAGRCPPGQGRVPPVRPARLSAQALQHVRRAGAPGHPALHRDLESAMRDRFGKTPLFVPEEDGAYFHFDVPVCVSPQFYGWVCGFGGKVEVTAPAEVRKGIHDMVQALAKQHD